MNYSAIKKFILGRLEKELSPDLYYHGFHHTIDVLMIAESLCKEENINEYETILVKTAAIFHDAGYLRNNINHEVLGCNMVQEYLPSFGYSEKAIEKICEMIMSTKIPQSPTTNLEKIICDADLDYLGRDDFKKIGDTLFEELKAYNYLETREEWDAMQIIFLEKHTFFTESSQNKRQAKKAEHLQQLKKRVQKI
jgi:uncharacterized domain HDIG